MCHPYIDSATALSDNTSSQKFPNFFPLISKSIEMKDSLYVIF